MFPAHLGTGQTIDLDSPSLASEVLYDHAYVAARNNAGYRIPAGNMNLYAYVRNNPVNAVDPSGLLDCATARPSLEGEKCNPNNKSDDNRIVETIHCVNTKGQKTTVFCCLVCMVNFAAGNDKKAPFIFQVTRCRETPTPCSGPPWSFVEDCFPSVRNRRFEIERERRRFEIEQSASVWR